VLDFITATYGQYGGPGVNAHREIAKAMNQYGVSPEQVARVTGIPLEEVQADFKFYTGTKSPFGGLQTVYDPKTGREFESPNAAIIAGVGDYVDRAPTLGLPRSLQGMSTEQIASEARKLGVTMEQLIRGERQGEIQGGLTQQMLTKAAEYKETLSPQELISRLQKYKNNPPRTEAELQEARALNADYNKRVAFAEIGGQSGIRGLELPRDFLSGITPQYTAYSGAINSLLNSPEFGVTKQDREDLKNTLITKPAVNEAIQTLTNAGVVFDPLTLRSSIYSLSNEIDRVGETAALRGFYQRYANTQGIPKFAAGGLASLPKSRGYYLGGATDGMADQIPATIDGTQQAALSDGEFVIPADVVSHLGNGNSDAGAKQLYSMMDRVRQARTGRQEQGRKIAPNKFLPV
jgi:hypothetical protein